MPLLIVSSVLDYNVRTYEHDGDRFVTISIDTTEGTTEVRGMIKPNGPWGLAITETKKREAAEAAPDAGGHMPAFLKNQAD